MTAQLPYYTLLSSPPAVPAREYERRIPMPSQIVETNRFLKDDFAEIKIKAPDAYTTFLQPLSVPAPPNQSQHPWTPYDLAPKHVEPCDAVHSQSPNPANTISQFPEGYTPTTYPNTSTVVPSVPGPATSSSAKQTYGHFDESCVQPLYLRTFADLMGSGINHDSQPAESSSDPMLDPRLESL